MAKSMEVSLLSLKESSKSERVTPGITSGVVICAAFLGFVKNMFIAFTTGTLWDAVGDYPHGAQKGWSLWFHLAGMIVWTFAACYQFFYSGPITKERHLQISEVLCPSTSVLQERTLSNKSSLEVTKRHILVGNFVAVPALCFGAFCATCWQFGNMGRGSAAPTSLVFFYTENLATCSVVHAIISLWHAKQIKKNRQAKETVRLADHHLQMHLTLMFLACCWAADPGVHRIIFWGRLAFVYLEPTRLLIFPPGTSYETARDDPLSQALVQAIGSQTINLLMASLVAWNMHRMASKFRQVSPEDKDEHALQRSVMKALFFNFCWLSVWFLGNIVEANTGPLAPLSNFIFTIEIIWSLIYLTVMGSFGVCKLAKNYRLFPIILWVVLLTTAVIAANVTALQVFCNPPAANLPKKFCLP